MGLLSQSINLLFLSRFLLLQVYQPDILLLFFPLKNLVFLILYIVKIVAFLPFFLSSFFQSFFSRSFHPAIIKQTSFRPIILITILHFYIDFLIIVQINFYILIQNKKATSYRPLFTTNYFIST